jgi:hypothetical protein
MLRLLRVNRQEKVVRHGSTESTEFQKSKTFRAFSDSVVITILANHGVERPVLPDA